MKKFIVTTSVIFSFVLLSGQGDFSDPYLSSEQHISYALQRDANGSFLLAGINMSTGNKTCIASIPEIQGVGSSFSDINAKEGIFHFMTIDNDQKTHLVSMSVTNGQLISDVVIEQSSFSGYIKELQVDPNTGILYALNLKSVTNSNQVSFISIDPATGLKTVIGNLPSLECIQLGFSAIDWRKKEYYFMGLDTNMVSHFYTVDLNNGSVLNSPVVKQDIENGYVKELAINSSTGELFALHRTCDQTPVVTFISINPETGAKTFISTIPGVTVIQHSFSSINSNDGLYYFVGQDEDDDYDLFWINLNNGGIVAEIPFNEFEASSTMYEMHFPNLLPEQLRQENIFICEGDSALISLPGIYDEYDWSNGAHTQSIYVSDSSKYSATLIKKDIGRTSTNEVSFKIYDCTQILDTVNFTVNHSDFNLEEITEVYTDNIYIENDNVMVTWNFIFKNKEEVKIEAEYEFAQNGTFVIGCQIESSSRDDNMQKVYYDILTVNHLGGTLSIDEPTELEFQAYPNPASSYLNLKLNANYKNIRVELLSLNGQLLYNNQFSDSQQVSLNVADYKAGFYLVKVTTEKETKLMKVVIK